MDLYCIYLLILIFEKKKKPKKTKPKIKKQQKQYKKQNKTKQKKNNNNKQKNLSFLQNFHSTLTGRWEQVDPRLWACSSKHEVYPNHV